MQAEHGHWVGSSEAMWSPLPCPSPSLSCSALHMPVPTQAIQMVRSASPPRQFYDTYTALPPPLQELS